MGSGFKTLRGTHLSALYESTPLGAPWCCGGKFSFGATHWIRSFSKPRRHEGDGDENVTKQKVSWAEQWLCTCILNLCTFLCRPLQNINNVKWLITSACFEERERQRLIFYIFFWNWTLSVHVQPEQVFRLAGVLNRFTQLRHSKVKYKYIF